MGLLDERIAYKPTEYDTFKKVTKLIRKTHWIEDELDFIQDKADFHNNLDDKERYIIGTILKSFAQTETQVANDFWGVLKDYIGKPEFKEMATTNAENEWRHASSYDKLSEVLGLQDYETFLEDKILTDRLENLAKLKPKGENGEVDVENLAMTMAVFGGFMEYVSLFSQFAIILSVSNRGMLPDTGNIIAWSQRDEALHAMSAMYTFNTLVDEYNLDRKKMGEKVKEAAMTTYEIELRLIAQIFEKGDLPNLKEADLIEFMKMRVNEAMTFMKFEAPFEVDEKAISRMQWFIAEYSSLEMADFFFFRPVEYMNGEANYSADNLF